MKQRKIIFYKSPCFNVIASSVVALLVITSFSRTVLGETNNAKKKKQSGTLLVEVGEMRNDKGVLGCALFFGKDGFPDENEKATLAKSDIHNGVGTCVFSNLAKGTYAVMVLHDEDSNGKMKFSAIGLPQEGYAASNDAKDGVLSGPSYEDAKFDFDGRKKNISISMRYR